VIAVLEDQLLDMEIAHLRLAVEQTEVQCRKLQHRGDLAAFQAEAARKHGLEQQLEALNEKKNSLLIRAPAAGTIVARGLDQQLGRYLEAGGDLCLIAGARRVVRGSLGQNEVETFRRHLNRPVRVHLPGAGSLQGVLTSIEPAASRAPSHRGLCAPYGGPLPVVRNHLEGAAETLEYLEPRFNAKIALADSAWAGRLCEVRLEGEHESIGAALLHILRRWWRNKTSPATRSNLWY
jgi:hypothetical protein